MENVDTTGMRSEADEGVPRDSAGTCQENPKPKREAIRRRKRILSCPICKVTRGDHAVVPDGRVCRGGHIRVDNLAKVWQCMQ